jgi:hypothetical protein
MPLAWIHELSKQQLDSSARQLGLPCEGTLDELRKRVREKWTAIETYLPSQPSAKSFQTLNTARSVTNSNNPDTGSVNKIRVKLVTDLIANIPILVELTPESTLKFLIHVNNIIELKLISTTEF